MVKKGLVYLVGAGPGDPGLITVKGLQCINRADVIIYDWLASDQLLEEAKLEVELIYVGKMGAKHAMEQEQINALIVEKAEQGKIVTRLKGGDPFVFGRGGEEAEALVERGLPFEVIPGVTSAVAVPAYAGIPVTHRRVASSFATVTGHEDPTKGHRSSMRWSKLATGTDTIVFLMGVGNLPQIVEQLRKNGRSASTPIALIRNGTEQSQRTISGTLETIVGQVQEANFQPPAVIVVGEVVQLRDRLRWFDNRPLFGKRVLVTRSRHQASVLSKLLAEHGADPIEMPTIQIEPMSDYNELDEAISNLESYDWIVFTSVNGVDIFFQQLQATGMDSRAFKGVEVCAIGPATADSLEERGIRADFIPSKYAAAEIVSGFSERDVTSAAFLLPRAEIASQELVEGLINLGAKVHQIATYRTITATKVASKATDLLAAGEIDVITFTSSSTVRGFMSIVGSECEGLSKATVACIGPVTAATAEELGIRVDIVAKDYTIPGLVAAIEEAQIPA